MSAPRLYFDVDAMERAVIQGLRTRGVDAITAQEVGAADWDDEEQLEFACSQERVLFTFNASDFGRIHSEWLAQGKSHAGIILALQQRYSIGERIRRLPALLAVRSSEDMRNSLEFLSDWGHEAGGGQ
jgi:predicted nuclease of predicted toxin-antitoxin system